MQIILYKVILNLFREVFIMTNNTMYDEIDEMMDMDFETNEDTKRTYRKSRRSKRLEKKKMEKQKKSINYALGANKAKSYKKLSHKRNRRDKEELVDATTKCKYAFQNNIKIENI